MRILVIEDNAVIQANVLELLSEEGHDAMGASTGEGGIAAALAAPPDLVLCDVAMPGIGGFEVLAALRGHPTTVAIPFIFLSARAETTLVESGLRLGATAYLTKPFSRLELLEAIRASQPKGR